MARSGTAASKPANLGKDSSRSDGAAGLSRQQKLEDYVLPQTSDIVVALRKLAAY